MRRAITERERIRDESGEQHCLAHPPLPILLYCVAIESVMYEM